jgi:adenosylhomocysteine nucleosidase
MPIELKPLVKTMNLQRSGIDYTGSVAGVDVVAAQIGVGITRAAEETERVLKSGPVDRVIVVGICGGLDETVPIGSVLNPEIVQDGATGEAYHSPEWGPITLQGRLVTFEDFALELKMIPQLAREGAAAVDMETAGVASVCHERDVPYAVFRAISDYATDGSIDYEIGTMLNPDGSSDIGKGIRYMLRHPWRLPTLMRLGKGAQAATKAAAAAAIAAVSA